MKKRSNPERPQPGWITTQEAADGVGITRRNFAEWRIEPCGKVGNTNYYLIKDVVDAAVRRRSAAPPPTTGEPEHDKPIDQIRYEQELARAELLKEQAEAKRLENEITRHETAPMEWFQFVLGRMATRVASMLDGIPIEIMRARGLGPEAAETAKGIIAVALHDVHDLGSREFLEKALDDYLDQGAG